MRAEYRHGNRKKTQGVFKTSPVTPRDVRNRCHCSPNFAFSNRGSHNIGEQDWANVATVAATLSRAVSQYIPVSPSVSVSQCLLVTTIGVSKCLQSTIPRIGEFVRHWWLGQALVVGSFEGEKPEYQHNRKK